MGITDVLTAEYFCSLLGVSTVETTSIRKENSIEGELVEYGQKSMAMQQRNLFNVDEILRLAANKLILNLRGNKPLQLDKIIYKDHPLAKQLKDSPISEYNPKWIRNVPQKAQEKEKKPLPPTEEKIGWSNF